MNDKNNLDKFNKIIKFPNLILRKIGKNVEKSEINNLDLVIKKMSEIMYSHSGIGLSATQINLQKNIFIMDTSLKKNNLIVFINPKIISSNENYIDSEEGCLSIPKIMILVKRIEKITVRAMNLELEIFEKEFKDIDSFCIQHEIDHLNGKLILDKISEIKKKIIINKIYKENKKHFQ